MRLARGGMLALLYQNAVELRFRRRLVKPGYSYYRRMFCTNDMRLLKSGPGVRILNFNPPTGAGLKYDPAAKNLIVCWDIFLQDWRCINCDDVEAIAVIRTTPPDQFWKYFFNNVKDMSKTHKARFMNS